MSISYKKLFHLMIDKGVSNSELMDKAQISANIIPRMKRNGYISLETAEKICRAMDCSIEDILEFTDEETDA